MRWGSDDLTVNRAGIGEFSAQFEGTDPPLDDGIWHVVTDSDHVQIANSLLDAAGGGFARWMLTDAADIAILDAVSQGDGVLLAFTMPVVDLMPTAPTIPDQTATVGTAFDYTLPTATGGDDPITTSADQLPTGLTLTSGEISGTPTAAGTTTVTITYEDADGDIDTAAFDIVVAAAAATAAAAVDTAVEVGDTLRVTLAETTELTGTITYSAANLPSGATFTPATRLLEWTPTDDAVSMVTYTASDGTDSEVTRFLLMAHQPDQPRYGLLVDWDGDGSFSHPLTDAFGDLTKGGVKTTRGRDYASMIYGRAVAGTLNATLVNYDGDYDRFSTSDLSGLLLPRRRVIFVLAAAGEAYRLWTGFLDEVKKIDRTGGNDVVRVRATDILGDLARTDCGVAYMATTTAGEAAVAVLDAANIDAGDRGDIQGPTQISNYFATDAKALLHLRELEETEAGFLWVSGAGKINLEHVNQRYTQTRSRQVQAAITDSESYGAGDLLIIPPPKQHDPMKDIANVVTVRVRKWAAESEADLWTLPEAVEIEAGDQRTFLVSTSDDGAVGRDARTGRYLSFGDLAIREWIAPVANTDYTANTAEDGSGTDRTSSLAIEFTDAGTSARLGVENQHASDTIYLTAKVRGRVLNEEQPLVLELRDEDSIADYGPRPYTVATELLGSADEAQTYGQYILTLYGQPTRKAEVTVEVSDHLQHAGERDLSDRVEYTARGISTDMYVESIGHVLRPGFRHDMRLTMSQAGLFDDVIILDGGPGLDTGILGA